MSQLPPPPGKLDIDQSDGSNAFAGVSAPFIIRPIATTLLAFAVVLAGWLAYMRLPVSSLPQVDFPTIQVTTQLPGANPDTMANLVTGPLERQLGQIPGVATITSTSSYGISQITLQFVLDRDIDAGSQDVQSAINAASSTLPRTLPYPPTYAKVNPADTAIVTLALTSPSRTLRQMSDLADTMISQRMSTISGVGRVTIEGGIKPAVRIQADLARLSSYGLSMADLRNAIIGANVSGPKGSLDGTSQSYTIAANDQITNAAAYKSVIIAYRNQAPVLLTDVADVIDGLENTRVGGWYQGQPAVIINVQRQPGANVIETVQRLKSELPRLERSMPTDVKLTLVHDRTEMIRASIKDVQFTLVLATILVVLVVLAFLRSTRATIIAGVALPVSLIATFGVMWLAGFSLDNLSLMALTIGTGFVVDDAIVMIENIVRHLEDGESPMEAAMKGAREIGFTVISLTLSLIAVFIPLLFMTGLIGRMFREFALTLTIAVIVSAIVSLTLTPMMCARVLKATGKPHGSGATVDTESGFYMRTLRWVLNHQTATLVFTLFTFALTAWLYIVMPKGLLPAQDTGLVTAVLEAGPETSFEEMSRLQTRIADQFRKDVDVASVVSLVGVSQLNTTPNAANFKIILKPRAERKSTAPAVMRRLEQATNQIAGTRLFFQAVQDVQIATRASTGQYQFTLTGSDQIEVNSWANKLAANLSTTNLFRNVTTDTQDGGLRALVRVDRETAGRLGVSMQSINDALNDAFGQRQISTIYAQSNQYRVVLEAQPAYQSDPAALGRVYVPGLGGAQVPLNSLAKIERITAPLAINHQEQFPAATIAFDLAPNAALSAAVEALNKAEKDIGVPGLIVGRFSGDAAEFSKSLASQPWLILAAIVTIYIVLGVLYESFIHPFTILTTLPSAGIGALLALLICGLDLSMVALIGIVLLMGIVKKNAIMMIDFALEAERTRGLSPEQSILEAAHLRFRPIMMTTLAALLGALPLALENGAGSELRFPLGVSIIGGLLLSQLLTLYTTPVIYLFMERLKNRLMGTPVTVTAEPAPTHAPVTRQAAE
ncbi:MAG: acriflavine resistance protein B [Hyphomicrobiaceae bacterium]|nr:acriflavine resistance protein B [Hyphomicrobiaceae bacterium]